uniref:Reverse transcriptase Ty1/copia-type domain-containing protein n=1 Tax=Fagus sylvatica TaxID=28930 RepID=A0A2N9IBI2_FAGSY
MSAIPFYIGFLKEDVFMQQPQGYVDSSLPTHVFKLHKSLYGLKQSPRAWFERFTTHLLDLGFCASVVDPSLFIFSHAGVVLYLLLYVDDIILTGNDSTAITALISQLASMFELKDLGPLRYFLGLQVDSTAGGLFVHQQKYISDLLSKFHMVDCKVAPTPFVSSQKLLTHAGDLLSDPTSYQSLVGALQYATFTQPDITFAVNHACQFMHAPTSLHLTTAERILCYLKGSLDLGIFFQPGSLHLTAFINADWAGDPNDRHSTTSLAIFLGHNPITWLSKKQHTVSRSSIEAEYRSLATRAAELAWICQVLYDMGLFLSTTPVIWCDNTSALALASNFVFHGRTKHIEADYHFIRERVI